MRILFVFAALMLLLAGNSFSAENNIFLQQQGTYNCGLNSQGDDSLAAIIGVVDSSVNTIDNLRASFAGLHGVKLICYDNVLGVFVVKGVTGSYSSREEVYNACQKVAGSTRLYLKTGSAKEIVSHCPLSGFNDPAVIKTFLDN